ncbi:hypothetical protein H0X06_00840 [Candidatus Dependentiae bacterium]|nr:hypothetical protein [Candidatus Dependentiae bacterium]
MKGNIKKITEMVLYSLLIMTSIVDCMERSFEQIKDLEKNESIQSGLTEKGPLCCEHCNKGGRAEGFPGTEGLLTSLTLCSSCTEDLIGNQFQCPRDTESLAVRDPLALQEKIHSQVSEEVCKKPVTIHPQTTITSIIPSSIFTGEKKPVKKERLSSSFESWGPLISFAYTPDGNHILAISADCTARLFEAHSGKLVKVVQRVNG